MEAMMTDVSQSTGIDIIQPCLKSVHMEAQSDDSRGDIDLKAVMKFVASETGSEQSSC